MRDTYKVNVINQHIEAAKADEYYTAQLTGKAGKPINLDNDALQLLKEHYEGEDGFPVKSPEEVLASMDEDGRVEGYVDICIYDIIDNSAEDFLDMISMKLVNSDLLIDIDYDIVGHRDGLTLILKVSGDASEICSDDEEEEGINWLHGMVSKSRNEVQA